MPGLPAWPGFLFQLHPIPDGVGVGLGERQGQASPAAEPPVSTIKAADLKGVRGKRGFQATLVPALQPHGCQLLSTFLVVPTFCFLFLTPYLADSKL